MKGLWLKIVVTNTRNMFVNNFWKRIVLDYLPSCWNCNAFSFIWREWAIKVITTNGRCLYLVVNQLHFLSISNYSTSFRFDLRNKIFLCFRSTSKQQYSGLSSFHLFYFGIEYCILDGEEFNWLLFTMDGSPKISLDFFVIIKLNFF